MPYPDWVEPFATLDWGQPGYPYKLVFKSPDASGVWPERPVALVVPIPGWAKAMKCFLVSGGSGGGSGARRAAGGIRSGGGGGGSSPQTELYLPVNYAGAPTSLTLTVGNGGSGGAAITVNDTNGSSGVLGARTFFVFDGNTYGSPTGGTAASGGGTSQAAGAGVAQTAHYAGSAGQASNVAANVSTYFPSGLISGGGAGGSIDAANVAYLGNNQVVPANITALTFPSGQSVAGVSIEIGLQIQSVGGTGGAANNAANAGAGGNGIHGSGGGGGGASLNGFNSGAGGRGGDGVAIFIWE